MMRKRISFGFIGVLLVMGGAALYAQTEADFNTAAEGNGVVITKYKGEDTDAVIPATIGGKAVIAIGKQAFFGNAAIKSVILPEGIEIIGESAFENCTELASINFPKSLKAVEPRAFWGCLTLVVFSYIEIKNKWGNGVIGFDL